MYIIIHVCIIFICNCFGDLFGVFFYYFHYVVFLLHFIFDKDEVVEGALRDIGLL